jgi:hypothetical protein
VNASRLLFEGLEDRILLDGTGGLVGATVFTETHGPVSGTAVAGTDIVFTLPKFDDMGGTRTLLSATLRSTTVVVEGARHAQNASPFAGILDELTFTMNTDTTVDVAPGTMFTFGPTALSESLINVPMNPGDIQTADITGETTGLLDTVVLAGDPQLSDFILAPGDTTITFTATSGTTVTLVTTGFVANSWTDPAVSYTLTGEVVYQYTEGEDGGTDEMYFGAALPEYERLPKRFQPLYTGTAQPGATLAIDILGPGGEVLGSTSTMVDAGGNWVANFYDTYMTGEPHTVSIRQLQAGYTPLEGMGYNLRRYFSPAILGGAYASERLTVENVFGSRSASVSMAALYEASAHPFSLGLAPHAYEMLAYPAVPQGLH